MLDAHAAHLHRHTRMHIQIVSPFASPTRSLAKYIYMDAKREVLPHKHRCERKRNEGPTLKASRSIFFVYMNNNPDTRACEHRKSQLQRLLVACFSRQPPSHAYTPRAFRWRKSTSRLCAHTFLFPDLRFSRKKDNLRSLIGTGRRHCGKHAQTPQLASRRVCEPLYIIYRVRAEGLGTRCGLYGKPLRASVLTDKT